MRATMLQTRRLVAEALPREVDLGLPLRLVGSDLVTTTGWWTRQGDRVFRAVDLEPEDGRALCELTCWARGRQVAWDILVD